MPGPAVRAVQDRLAGRRPSRLRALTAAVTAGVAAGVLVYRVLRSAGENGEEADENGEEAASA